MEVGERACFGLLKSFCLRNIREKALYKIKIALAVKHLIDKASQFALFYCLSLALLDLFLNQTSHVFFSYLKSIYFRISSFLCLI